MQICAVTWDKTHLTQAKSYFNRLPFEWYIKSENWADHPWSSCRWNDNVQKSNWGRLTRLVSCRGGASLKICITFRFEEVGWCPYQIHQAVGGVLCILTGHCCCRTRCLWWRLNKWSSGKITSSEFRGSAESPARASPSAGATRLTVEGVSASAGDSWAGWAVEAAEASSSVFSSSVSKGTALAFGPVALLVTSMGAADTSAGPLTARREDCCVESVLELDVCMLSWDTNNVNSV